MAKQDLLAIDVGTGVIKVFSGFVDHHGILSITGNGIVPTDGFSKGMVVDQDSLTKALSLAVDCVAGKDDLRTTPIYLGISGMGLNAQTAVGHVSLKSLNGITQSDLDRVYRAAVLTTVPEEMEILHVLPKCFRVDDQIVSTPPFGQNGKQLEADVLIVTLPKKVIHEFISSLEAAGVRITGVVANAVAVGHSFKPDLVVSSCIILDIGAGNTDIAVYDDGKMVQIQSLPFGGDYITSDIMQGVGIDHQHAEAVKRYFAKLDKRLYGQEVVLDCNDNGTTDKNIPYDFLYQIIESRVEEIVTLIYESLTATLSERNVEKIYITGGCSLMNSFSDCFEKISGVPVVKATADQLSPEYSNPINTACYGVMHYAAQKHIPLVDNARMWDSLFTKVKDFLKPSTT